MHLAALEAFISAVELQASGNVAAAYDAIQTVLAISETVMTLKHPWTAREQCELDTILRGSPPDEARDRVHQCLSWHKFTIGAIAARSDWVRKGAVEREIPRHSGTRPVLFNRRLIAALAEKSLPQGREGTKVALRHLRDNYPDLWEAVKPRIKSSWWRTWMAASQKGRPTRKAYKLRGQSLGDQFDAAAVSNLPALEPPKRGLG